MPDQENDAQGVSGEKQKDEVMFRWESHFRSALMRTEGGDIVAQVLLPPYLRNHWESWVGVNGVAVLVARAETREEAMAAAECWWRAAAKTAKELGL